MSLRYRLLLIVGFVSTLVFMFAFFLNNRLLDNNLMKIRKEAAEFVQKSYSKRRDSMEQFIYDELSRKLAQVNAILETVTQFPSLSDWFSPNAENLQMGTWSNASYFLQDEDWIQFLQNTSDNKLLSMVVPDEGPFFQTEAVPVEEGIAWVSILSSQAYPEPCLGVQLPFKNKEQPMDEGSTVIESSGLPVVYVLYTVNKLKEMTFSANFLQNREELFYEPSLQGYEIDDERFYQHLQTAIMIARNPELKIPEKSTSSGSLASEEKNSNLADKYLKEILDYSNELFLLGEVTSLQKGQLFTSETGETVWPDAVSSFEEGKPFGNAFFLKTVLGFSEPFFDDQAYFNKHPPKPGTTVSSGSAVIKSPHQNQAFFVNTAALYEGEGADKKQSLLTIGFDMSDFMYNVSAIAGNYGCLMSGGQVLTKVTPHNAPPINFKILPEIFAKQTAPQGFFFIGDVEYFFIKIYPDEAMDLYFCFFTPKKVAMGLYMQVQDKVKAILANAWTQRVILEFCSLLILWILLLDLSKKITRPIVSLSRSLKFVKTGDWDRIKAPSRKLKKNNEIDQLIGSFHEMVEGLKEKEKMSGVLNKVVSKEIASEILKGDVHLGGEEKVVTMFFADIRGFTNITQNMAPHDTINLLNTCMTKLSQVIEDHKGVIDKYLGDGIMALYGAPVSYEDSPLNAVISGLEMIESIKKWDEERIKEGQVPLDIGIGIHTGTVCAGNMGALNRLNYTVIGSHVNMASRLCFAAGPGEVLITADTYAEPCINQNVEVEDKGFMTFKGFDEKKQVYKVIRLKQENIENTLVLQGDE
jgi:class 3 adenylate cyclase